MYNIAKLSYHDILANVDVLHGVAESFLTITNLFIIQGFRMTRTKSTTNSISNINNYIDSLLLSIPLIIIIISYVTNMYSITTSTMLHSEPWNALSIPTWIVHSSSLLEWLVAMKLIWEHAITSGALFYIIAYIL